MPSLAIVRGDMSPGDDAEARIGRVWDLATFKSAEETRLPLRARAPRAARVEGGTTLVVELESSAYGVTSRLYGPVVRLSRDDVTADSARSGGSFWLSESTRVRLALDDRDGSLAAGDHVRASLPGLGAIDRALVAGADSAPSTDGGWSRFFVAHGAAVGLPLAALALAATNPSPGCVALCTREGQLLDDRSYLDELVARAPEDIARDRDRLETFELATFAASFATVLIPTARRGVFSRFELLEDALIIGEGILVGATTPHFLQARIGRARPIAFHPALSPGMEGRDAITALFVAPRTTISFAAASSAVTLLLYEEAGEGWSVPAILGLGALAGLVAYSEVRAGEVYPSDVPLGVFQGIASGAGVVFWNQIFWRGWPGDPERGELPVRVRGLDVRFDGARGAVVGAHGTF